MAKPSRRERAKHLAWPERRNQLLRAGIAKFANKGIDATKHADLARACGVSVPTVFAYFPNRQALVQEILDEVAKLEPAGNYRPPSLKGTVVMPGFHGGANWSAASFDPETGYLFVNATNLPNIMGLKKTEAGARYDYTHNGYRQFRDSRGYPATKPPWGELLAIDLNRGEIAWRVPLGVYKELEAAGVPQTGTENFGGTIVTKGGLVFIGGTKDEMFRAFNKDTGEVLWEYQLPFGGYATPSTYSVDGQQYVVIAACGGGKPRTKSGDKFMAFRLKAE